MNVKLKRISPEPHSARKLGILPSSGVHRSVHTIGPHDLIFLTIVDTSTKKEMAKLMRLQISGIRSFGPYEEHTQQLKFESPLTLILGQNGCGKTTIIEAIKYACSAELPLGTNNGQGFVNDPKMSRTASTKGQIKLKFMDPRGNEVTVIRVVEVSQTATSLKFCSKSSTIRTQTPDGNERSLSNRCADITAECCQTMNVSAAVLNNVIFCHQENSAWPLDEGKKLKEKFDTIFDAQKYNKCVEMFRKDLKKKHDSLKLLKLELKYNEEKKQQVSKEKRSLEAKQDRLQVFEDDIHSKNQELNPMKKRMEEIFELEQVLGDLEKQLTTKQATKTGVIEEQRTIKRNLPFEFEGSDEELHNKIKSFEEDRQRDQNSIASLEQRKSEIDDKTKIVVNYIQEAQTDLGKLNQQKSQYEKKCIERKRLIEDAKGKMEVNEIQEFSDNRGAKTALYELKTALETKEMCLSSIIEEHEQEQKTLQVTIDQARENTVRTKQNMLSKQKEAQTYGQKILDISNELTSLSTSDDLLANSTNRIATIDKTVVSLNNSFRETEESQKTESWRKDIETSERDLEILEGEYRVLLQNDITEGKMESEKHLIMGKQKAINTIKAKHSDSLKQLFGDTVPERNLKESVLTMQRNADVSVKNLTERITKKQKEVTTLEVQRQHQQEKVATCEKELKTNRDKIAQVCSGKDFNETLESTFQKKERLQIDKGQYSSVRIIYNQFIKKFEEESPCCPVCETDFSQKQGIVNKIITALKNKLGKVPQELTRVENELQKEESFYSKLQQLKFVNEETEIIAREKLPQLKQCLDEIEESLKRDKSELNELKAQLNEPQKIVDISKKIISDVSSLDQNSSDVEKSTRILENLKRDLVQVPSNKSKQEVEAEIEHLKAEVTEMRGKLDAQTKKFNKHKDRIQQLLQEKTTLVEKQMRLKESLQSRPALEAQRTELNNQVKILKEEISELQTNLYLLEAELQNVIESKDSVTKKSKQQIQEERDKIRTYNKIVQDIEKLQNEIDSYLNEEVEKKLETAEEKLKNYRNKKTTLDDAKNKIIGLIGEKREDLAKQELKFTTLKNNVILREKKCSEVKLESEIQDLKRRIGGYNYRTVYEEKRQLVLQRENLEKEINSLTGEKNELMKSIEELRLELEKPANKRAHINYMKKLYQLKIRERVIQDFEKFIVAVEKAVLDFHRSKMVQINKNIRELWRDIYRGNDIDHIEIKTEYASGSSRKRSYDYKVVQFKKGVELDMRGRCSAGQKVLACLVIRMALAETLSANCGILALDEPTTNLDRENIQSLCDTLIRIVNTRQREQNFQLLVITHDEEFLNALTRVQGVSHYYRVERDNNGFSVIKKQYAI